MPNITMNIFTDQVTKLQNFTQNHVSMYILHKTLHRLHKTTTIGVRLILTRSYIELNRLDRYRQSLRVFSNESNILIMFKLVKRLRNNCGVSNG